MAPIAALAQNEITKGVGLAESDMAAQHTPLRDPARTFTPLGRPFRKPRKVVASLSSLDSIGNLDECYILERPQLGPKKPVGFREYSRARPPHQSSDAGPSPCSYTVPPPPRCSQGGKINPRAKYDRDALPRPNYEVWTLNVRTLETSPSPSSYAVTNSLGGKSPSKKAGPAYTMRGRQAPKKANNTAHPAPNLYNTAQSADYISRHFPSFSIGTPNHKKKTESSPGPAHYHPKHSYCQYNSPSFTFKARNNTV